jgi:hypothetical protein
MPSGHLLEGTGRIYGRKPSQTLSNERAIHAATMILFPRPRFHTSAEHKGCMLTFLKLVADFSKGCAG